MNPRGREDLAEIKKTRALKADKSKGSQQSQVWEFETYIKERLRSLGIIQ